MTCRERAHFCLGRQIMPVMAMLMAIGWFSPPPATSEEACLSASGEAAVQACRRELRGDPGNRDIRLALSDAYLSLKRYEDAVAVLREGFEHFPGDDTIKRQLILAESYLEEQQWIEKRKKDQAAAKRTGSDNTQTRLSVIRCNKLKGEAAISACTDGLKRSPDNPDLLTGRGSAWMALNQYGKAIADFRASLAAAPGNRDATKQLRLAETKREVKASQCLKGSGQKGLGACDAALLAGASDEFSIRRQQGRLLHAMGHEKAAVRAYRAASRLNPTDTQVRQALVALSPPPQPDTPSPRKKAVAVATPPAKATTAAQKHRKTTPTTTTLTAVTPPSREKPKKAAVSANTPSKNVALPPGEVIATSDSAAEVPGAQALPPVQPETPTTIAQTDSVTTIIAKTDTSVSNTRQPQPSVTDATNPQRQYSNLPRVPGISH